MKSWITVVKCKKKSWQNIARQKMPSIKTITLIKLIYHCSIVTNWLLITSFSLGYINFRQNRFCRSHNWLNCTTEDGLRDVGRKVIITNHSWYLVKVSRLRKTYVKKKTHLVFDAETIILAETVREIPGIPPILNLQRNAVYRWNACNEKRKDDQVVFLACWSSRWEVVLLLLVNSVQNRRTKKGFCTVLKVVHRIVIKKYDNEMSIYEFSVEYEDFWHSIILLLYNNYHKRRVPE